MHRLAAIDGDGCNSMVYSHQGDSEANIARMTLILAIPSLVVGSLGRTKNSVYFTSLFRAVY